MLRKLKNGFIGLMCIVWVTLVWLIAPMDYSDLGGAELNGFLAFILWIVSMYLIIKVNAIIPAVGSTVILLIIRISKFGISDENFERIAEPIMVLIVFFVVGKLFLDSIDKIGDEAEERQRRKKNARDRGEACCPWCGSVSIQYYALGIPYKDDYGSIRHSYKKYHCNNCGCEWE